MSMRGWLFRGHGAGSKGKAPMTSGGRKTPVRHTIPLGIVIFLVFVIQSIENVSTLYPSFAACDNIINDLIHACRLESTKFWSNL